jgi:hypothetical protein
MGYPKPLDLWNIYLVERANAGGDSVYENSNFLLKSLNFKNILYFWSNRTS